MSKFNKSVLAAALTLAVAGTAHAAATVKPIADAAHNNTFAYEITGGTSSNPTAQLTGGFTFNLSSPDILIGRTNAAGDITVTINFTGAELAPAAGQPANPIAIDAAAQCADDDAGGPDTAGCDANLEPVIKNVTYGTTSLQFVITPGSDGLRSGDLFRVTGLNFVKAAALANKGAITAGVTVVNTATNTTLTIANPSNVLSAVDATKLTLTPGATIPKIDVSAASAKKKFVGGGTVVNLGTLVLGRTDVDSTQNGDQFASAAGVNGGVAYPNRDVNTFVYDAANDKLQIDVKVPRPAAFLGTNDAVRIIAQDTATCPATLPTAVAGQVEVFTKQSGDTFRLTAPVSASTGDTFTICAYADGTDVIDAQTIEISAQLQMAGTLTRAGSGASLALTKLAELQYNGTVVHVDHFNPAANTAQVSYLRVSNTSTVNGLVYIDAVCDSGTKLANQMTFTLNAGASRLVGSSDVEAATGACVGGGKLRLTVTGEFANMRVQNFLRNVTSVGTINTNVNTRDPNSEDKVY